MFKKFRDFFWGNVAHLKLESLQIHIWISRRIEYTMHKIIEFIEALYSYTYHMINILYIYTYMIEIPGVSSFLKSLPLFCYTFFGGDYVFCSKGRSG